MVIKFIRPLFLCIPLLMISGCGSKKTTTAKKQKIDVSAQKGLISQKSEKVLGFVNKSIKDMTFEELKAKKDELLAKDDKENAIKYLEKAIVICLDTEELKHITIELADLHFDTGSLEKAGKLYQEFSNQYPGDEKVEYADYRAIMSNFYLLLSKDRDQTKTQKALELTQKFLNRPLYHVHVADVKTIAHQCRDLLVESEFSIIEHYLNRYSAKSVRSRLAYVEKEFLPDMPELKGRILLAECQLAELENNQELLLEKQKELVATFPELAQATKMAEAKKPTKRARDRF